ncbi:hypothetical protein RBQ61_17595 [Sedimentibacter sp. MB35-C1]|uniref:hypothetical protein n=1 Tax=Sedimentibacter sp. MB35-C1 TaxID=3070995 RepID=UPI0027E0F6F6|nr:hypothetical protein [Sedimentibacter sp. MB35-C1]WMJ77351.1 hypothetical protein RBQ61_17595 [Sedimentibacter sp. MB35-C1]
MPDVKKNTSGYCNKPAMDMIDLFRVGSDGTLGVITEIEIELNRTHKSKLGQVTIFMPDEDKALDPGEGIERGKLFDNMEPLNIKPSAIEFFQPISALEMLKVQQKTNPAFSSVQEIKEGYHTAVYTEIEGDSDTEIWAGIRKAGRCYCKAMRR